MFAGICKIYNLQIAEECFHIWESEHHQFWTQMIQILQNSWLDRRKWEGSFPDSVIMETNLSLLITLEISDISDFFTYWFYSPIVSWLVWGLWPNGDQFELQLIKPLWLKYEHTDQFTPYEVDVCFVYNGWYLHHLWGGEKMCWWVLSLMLTDRLVRERAVVQLEVDNQASTQDHLSDFNFLCEHFQKIFNIFQHK